MIRWQFLALSSSGFLPLRFHLFFLIAMPKSKRAINPADALRELFNLSICLESMLLISYFGIGKAQRKRELKKVSIRVNFMEQRSTINSPCHRTKNNVEKHDKVHLPKRTPIPSEQRYNVWRTKASQQVLMIYAILTHVINVARHTGLDKNAQARLTQLKADLERIEKAKKVI